MRLLRKTKVDMIAPTPPELGDTTGGVFAELHNDRGETLYEVDLSPQLNPMTEVFEPNQQPQMVDAGERKHVVMVVVPDAPRGSSLVVRNRPREAAGGARRIASESAAADDEIIRVSLSDDEASE